jgi:predicted nucleic acid-binding protein
MGRRIIIGKEQFIPTKDQNFFFDTNIWLYMFGPRLNPDNRNTKVYSKRYKDILEAEASIVIDYLVVAEFANRYLRDYQRFLKETEEITDNWKQFRKTTEYQSGVQSLSDELYHILQATKRLPLEYNLADLSSWVDAFAAREIDFNDVVYWKTCVQHKLILVTHDADCDFADIDIVTANGKLGRSAAPSIAPGGQTDRER